MSSVLSIFEKVNNIKIVIIICIIVSIFVVLNFLVCVHIRHFGKNYYIHFIILNWISQSNDNQLNFVFIHCEMTRTVGYT